MGIEADSLHVVDVDLAALVTLEPGQSVTERWQEMIVWVVVSVIVSVVVWAREWRANALRPRRRFDVRILRLRLRFEDRKL